MRHELTATCYNKRGKKLSTAKNNYTKSHPLQKHFAKLAGESDRIYLHAEIAALLRCGEKVPHSIVVERYRNNGSILSPAPANPCKICRLAIKHFGVKKVFHT